MNEYEETLKDFKNQILSLNDEDVKGQALEIIDNPERKDGMLSLEQIRKLGGLVDLGKEASDLIIKQAEDENDAIEHYQNSLRDAYSNSEEELDVAVAKASDLIEKA